MYNGKLSRIARLCHANECHVLNFTEKTFANSHKTAKFAKVFSLKSFPLYSILWNPAWLSVACAVETTQWCRKLGSFLVCHKKNYSRLVKNEQPGMRLA